MKRVYHRGPIIVNHRGANVTRRSRAALTRDAGKSY
jgi:hypothetical protein